MAKHGRYFTQKGSREVIVRLILRASPSGGYVLRSDLARAVWADPVGRELFTKEAERAAELWAGNLIDWFSKYLTEHERAPERTLVVRERIGRAWAYRRGDDRADEDQMEADAARRGDDLYFNDAKEDAFFAERFARKDYSVEDTWSQQRVRKGQQAWRLIVLENFGGRCCVCRLPLKALLDAAHIRRWNDAPESRLDRENGLVLCANHHRAFDSVPRLLWFSDSGRIGIARRLAKSTSRSVRRLFRFHGRHMRPPKEPVALQHAGVYGGEGQKRQWAPGSTLA